jgi:hypothetical protein
MRPVRAAGSRWGGAPRPRSGNLPRQHRIMVRRAFVESQTPLRCEKPARTRAATPVLGHDRRKAAPDLRFCPSGHSRPKQKTTPSPQRQCRRRTGRAIPPAPPPLDNCAQNPKSNKNAPRRRPGPQAGQAPQPAPRRRPGPQPVKTQRRGRRPEVPASAGTQAGTRTPRPVAGRGLRQDKEQPQARGR